MTEKVTTKKRILGTVLSVQGLTTQTLLKYLCK